MRKNKIGILLVVITSVVFINCSSKHKAKTQLHTNQQNNTETVKRPNIIFIMTDDQDRETMEGFSNEVKTPHIKQLIDDGLRFEQFTTTSPVCTPTRYSTLSGRFACKAKNVVKSAKDGEPVSIEWNTSLEDNRLNLPKVLQANGYKTGMVGKWHLGGLSKPKAPAGFSKLKIDDPKVNAFLQNNQKIWFKAMKEKFGFDYASRIYSGNIKKGKGPKELGVHNMEWVIEGAQEFIRQSKDEPFFLYLATTVPHGPHPGPSIHSDVRYCGAGLLDKTPETGMPSRSSVLERAKAAGISEKLAWTIWLDDGIGAVRKTVEDLGLLENTIIIIMSDQEAKGKGSLYDNGIGAPCIASWKGSPSSGTTSPIFGQNIDWAPTILDLAGIEKPADYEVDGVSFAPLLKGETLNSWRNSAYYEIGLFRAVRNNDFKYISFRLPSGLKLDLNAKLDGSEVPMHNQYVRRKDRFPNWFDADQLYDLRKDPNERNNLANDPKYAKELAEMKELLSQHLNKFSYDYAEFTK